MNLIGNGGLAKQIASVVDSFQTYSITYGGRITLTDDDDSKPYIIAFASMNDLSDREWMYNKLVGEGKTIGSIVAPSAKVSPDIHLSRGAVILEGAYIGPGVHLDVKVLVGTRAIIEHDSNIGQHSIVLTGAIVNGGCNIGCRVMIGSGAVVINDITIVDDVTVGAGAVVVNDLIEPGTYVGCPARLI